MIIGVHGQVLVAPFSIVTWSYENFQLDLDVQEYKIHSHQFIERYSLAPSS